MLASHFSHFAKRLYHGRLNMVTSSKRKQYYCICVIRTITCISHKVSLPPKFSSKLGPCKEPMQHTDFVGKSLITIGIESSYKRKRKVANHSTNDPARVNSGHWLAQLTDKRHNGDDRSAIHARQVRFFQLSSIDTKYEAGPDEDVCAQRLSAYVVRQSIFPTPVEAHSEIVHGLA